MYDKGHRVRNGFAHAGNGDTHCHIEQLFRFYRNYEEARETSRDDDPVGHDAQSVLMAQAASYHAHSVREVLYKLALWRWDSPDVEDPQSLARYDAVAYSAFRDLARLLGDKSVLKAEEKEDA